MRARRRLAPRLALAALGILLGIAVLEVALRLAGGPREAGERHGIHEPRPDRAWLYGMRPGTTSRYAETGDVVYQTNADGFRDRPREHAKPDGVFRIAVLGDSVAFGHGVNVEDTFPADMERELARVAPDLHAEVLNLAVSGYNPWTEARLLEDVGARYQPDLVLAQFCINDLNDPTLHFDAHARLQLGTIPEAAFPDPANRQEPPAPPPMLSKACHSLRVCSMLEERWLAWTGSETGDAARRAAAVPHEHDGPEWTWLAARYAEMAAEAKRLGAGFAVIAFPYQAQLGRRGPDPVEARLVSIGERGGWTTIDLLPAFRRALREEPKQPLFLDWWHPTPRGHRVAARETLAALACAGLLPGDARLLCPGDAEAAATRH